MESEWEDGMWMESGWVDGMWIVKSEVGVRSGASLEEWESKDWIVSQDPYGWFQWYCRFFQGRRTKDDQRQVGRWVRVAGEGAGRWRNFLVGRILKSGTNYDDPSVSPVTRQTLQHWAYYLTKKDFRQRARQLENRS